MTVDETNDPTPTIAVPLLEGVGYATGRHVLAPMLAAALDAPDARHAITRTAVTTGVIVGGFIALGIILGRRL